MESSTRARRRMTMMEKENSKLFLEKTRFNDIYLAFNEFRKKEASIWTQHIQVCYAHFSNTKYLI